MFITLAFAATSALIPGTVAPDFTTKNQDEKTVKLSDYRGKPVLLYFYPKDDTPGCTKEACHFRDDYSKFQKLGVVILGISRQSSLSHRAFRAKFHLPFDLLTDEDGSIAKAYGVGKWPILGYLQRKSVLIDKDGKIVQFFDSVDPNTHSAELLRLLAQ